MAPVVGHDLRFVAWFLPPFLSHPPFILWGRRGTEVVMSEYVMFISIGVLGALVLMLGIAVVLLARRRPELASVVDIDAAIGGLGERRRSGSSAPPTGSPARSASSKK